MDTLTHALSGALLARASWTKNQRLSLRHRTQVGFLTAAFPDIDYILRLTTDNFLVYLNYHRGITHSVLMLPLWALLLSLIFSRLLKPAPDWRSLYLICCLGLGVHIAGDVITSYGTMIFSPFTDWRASLDTTFIIDPIFTGIILVALIFSVLFKKRQLIAITGLSILMSYIGAQAWAHHQAIKVGEQASQHYGWAGSTVSAMPQPLSPLHWKVIVEYKDSYRVALIRLHGDSTTATKEDGFFSHLYAAYQSPSSIEWSTEGRYGYRYQAEQATIAWQSKAIAGFRRFSRFPFLVNTGETGGDCYRFSDLRFVFPGREITHLFTYSVCRNTRSGEHALRAEKSR